MEQIPRRATIAEVPRPKVRNGSDVATAWPILPGFRPQSQDACVNWCAEGFGMHPEWKNDSNAKWRAVGNVLLHVLRILQSQMDQHYGGRFKQ